jgi:hypothetical protein
MFREVDIGKFAPPLYSSHNSLRNHREEVLSALPPKSTPFRKLFSPFIHDGEPFWNLNIQEGYFNHKYEPYTVLLYAIRDHYRDVYDYINGLVVANGRDYDNYRDEFNKSFMSALSRAHGHSCRTCSTDEMIRMGSLFLILLRSCDNREGLIIDYERRFMNPWSGVRVTNKILLSNLEHLSNSLQNVYMSGMHWQSFMFRYIGETDQDSVWFINLPSIDDARSDELEQEMTKDEMFSMFDHLVSIDKRGGKICMVVENSDKNIKFMKDYFKFKQTSHGRYSNSFLNLSRSLIEDLMVVSNYRLPKSLAKVS